jgi:hypothetical protein
LRELSRGELRTVLLACAAACVATSVSSRAFAQSAAPESQPAQAVVVVQLPFAGEATQDLLTIAEDATRNAVLARGATGPDRTAVRNALATTPVRDNDTASIVAFGRSMGATHVITGRVMPLAGQYNLELHLYEVATSRVATQSRNLGDGDEGTVIPEMLAALWAPGALQLAPEDRARLDAEQRARDDAERHAREEAERRARDEAAQRQRDEEARRQRANQRRIYTLSEGGPWSLGAGAVFGGRFTPVNRPPGAPPAESFLAALRLEGAYAVLPRFGLEAGLTAQLIFTPTSAFGIGATGRFWFPWRAYLPIHAGIGVTVGLFQGLTGARATSAFLSFDLRGEWDVTPHVGLWAAAVLDSIPGLYGSIAGMVGLRIHFGGDDPSARPAANANVNGSSSPPPTSSQLDAPIVAD